MNTYTDSDVLTYLEGLDASNRNQGVFGLIKNNTDKVGFSDNRVESYLQNFGNTIDSENASGIFAMLDANNRKTGISSSQASAITSNSSKVSCTSANVATATGVSAVADLINSNVTPTSLNLGPFEGLSLEDAYVDGLSDRNTTLLNTTAATSRSSLFVSNKFQVDREWGLGTSRPFTTNTARLYFRRKTSSGTVSNRAYIKDATTNSLNFTGQHRCEDHNDELSKSEAGLIVVSTGRYNNLLETDKPTINESLPIVTLSTKRNEKSCFGVLSDKEDRNGEPREYAVGNFVSVSDDGDPLDRLIINSIGEGAIWICNVNGNFENGDYITTCEIPGYGMRQDDDLLHNYTVAKITQDCTFELDNPYYDCVEFEFEGQTYRKAFVGCTYHCG